MFKNLIGTKEFYKGVFSIALPIMIQNVITNTVNLLDNVMVGQVGTEQMSGVAIINQLLFVVNLGIWGFTSGAGTLGAQYYGKKDHKGLGYTFKAKVIFAVLFILLTFGVFFLFGDTLIWQYLHEGNSDFNLEYTFNYAKSYLRIILLGYPFFAATSVYSSTLRDSKETRIPMIAGLSAVFVNFVFNYILIFGKFGFPKMGIIGAAIATNLSRVVECMICVIWTHTHTDQTVFIKDVFKDWSIPKEVNMLILKLAIPSFVNEILWSFGQTMVTQLLSLRGIEVISSLNISSAVNMLSKSFFLSIGISLSILVGNALGAGNLEEAVDTQRKMFLVMFSVSSAVALILFAASGLVPEMYNTEASVKALAATFIRLSAFYMPFDSLVNAEYHTIKCGGLAIVTFFFDGGFTWAVMIPVGFVLAHFTAVNAVILYLAMYGTIFIKLLIGSILVKKKIWVRNLVA